MPKNLIVQETQRSSKYSGDAVQQLMAKQADDLHSEQLIKKGVTSGGGRRRKRRRTRGGGAGARHEIPQFQSAEANDASKMANQLAANIQVDSTGDSFKGGGRRRSRRKLRRRRKKSGGRRKSRRRRRKSRRRRRKSRRRKSRRRLRGGCALC